MKMEKVNGKYERVLELLRRSEPVLNSSGEIEEKVMNRITATKKTGSDFAEFLDFIFSWTYNVRVRRSLVTASVILVMVFVFQQSIIMKQISQLSRQINDSEWDASSSNNRYINKSMLMFRINDRRFSIDKRDLSDKKIEELLRSIDHLKKEYKDLHELIEKDPELKKLIEQKLSEIDGSKVKL